VGGGSFPLPLKDLMEKAKQVLGSSSKMSSTDPTEFHKIVQVKDMMLDSGKLASLGFKWNHNILRDIEELCN
jgi:hypothetical protein